MTQNSNPSTAALGARFRFSVVGTLLSAPPAAGELKTVRSNPLPPAARPAWASMRSHCAGPVLVYLAEDALPVVRERVAGMARHRGLDLAGVEIHVITAPTLRLDRDPHRGRLLETAKRLRPRLLLLDPLVRLHGIDENNAGEVAGLLAYFRSLQRQLDLSVVLVHHTRKNAAGGVAAGQGLRGSSDIHAFGDSNLYLRRSRERLVLSNEHRGARFAAGLSGTGGDQRRDGPFGGRRGVGRRETAHASRSKC